MKDIDIIRRARECKDFAYWYGGKGELATEKLLKTLSKYYPSIYTPSYINKCKADIKAKKHVIDCSGLVCYAYDIPHIGSFQISMAFKRIDKPVNGCVLYRKGHVGIYVNGYVLEARGIDYDVTESRKFYPKEWIKYLIHQNFEQTKPEQYEDVVSDVIHGKYGNGTDRVRNLQNAGYDPILIQRLVNERLKV